MAVPHMGNLSWPVFGAGKSGGEHNTGKATWLVQTYLCRIGCNCRMGFFRADTIGQALGYLKCMFVFDLSSFKNWEFLLKIDNLFLTCFLISLVGITPVFRRFSEKKIFQYSVFSKLLYLLLWVISLLYMIGLSYNPFIYFMF